MTKKKEAFIESWGWRILRQKMTYEQLCEFAQVSNAGNISRYCTGKVMPTDRIFNAIENAIAKLEDKND